jgi:hypothetical protein
MPKKKKGKIKKLKREFLSRILMRLRNSPSEKMPKKRRGKLKN